MQYKTSLDNLAKGITIGFAVLISAMLISLYLKLSHPDNLTIMIPIILFLTLVFTFLFRPIQYRLEGNALIIHRLIGDVKLDRENINSVEMVHKDQMRNTMRTFGVGGLFGYFGKFSNVNFGSMTWYATRRNNYVLVKTADNKKIILTPDEPEQFVADCNKKV